MTKFALGVAIVALLTGCESGVLIEGRYLIQGSGDTVLDTVTGLEWQRCSLGQTWNGSICIRNAARMRDWGVSQMLEIEKKLESFESFAWGPKDENPWRIPTKDELRTLVFCSNGNPARFKNSDERCYGDHQVPTIVLRAFPNTPAAGFWSMSPGDRVGKFWSVDFTNGKADDWSLGDNAVRKVRDGQQR